LYFIVFLFLCFGCFLASREGIGGRGGQKPVCRFAIYDNCNTVIQ